LLALTISNKSRRLEQHSKVLHLIVARIDWCLAFGRASSCGQSCPSIVARRRFDRTRKIVTSFVSCASDRAGLAGDAGLASTLALKLDVVGRIGRWHVGVVEVEERGARIYEWIRRFALAEAVYVMTIGLQLHYQGCETRIT
jgi:hypothetical protein